MHTHATTLLFVLLACGAACGAAPLAASRRDLLQSSPGQDAAPGAAGSLAPAPAPEEAASSTLPSLEWPLSGQDWAMFVLSGIAMFVMAGAGVGGGMLLIPIFQLVGGMNITYSVALSSLCIGVSSIISVLFYVSRDHPLRPGSMVDWDLLLLFSQPVILGSTMGAMFNVLLPQYITNIVLALLVTPTMWRMGVQAMRLHRAEAAAAEALCALSDKAMQVDGEGTIQAWGSCSSRNLHASSRTSGQDSDSSRRMASQLQSANGSGNEVAATATIAAAAATAAAAAAAEETAGKAAAALDASGRGKADTQDGDAPEPAPAPPPAAAAEAQPPSALLRWMLREERARVPPTSCAILLAGLAALLVSKLVSSTALTCGTWQYWVMLCSIVPMLGLAYLAARAHVLRKQRVLAAYRPPPPPPDPDAPLGAPSAANGYLHFTRLNTLAIAGVCILAGTIAGLVGLGGGIVLMPLMIELHVHPQVASAVSQCSILLTSISAVLTYALADRIPWTYGYVLMVIAVFAAAAGQIVTEWLVRRHQKPSIILYILVGVGAIACGVIYYQMVDSIVDVARGDSSGAPGSLCSKS